MAGIVFLNPTLGASRSTTMLAPRLETLDGKVIGTLWNNRPHGDFLLERCLDLLLERWNIKEVVRRKKTFISSRAPNEVIKELKEKCDAVIMAVGD